MNNSLSINQANQGSLPAADTQSITSVTTRENILPIERIKSTVTSMVESPEIMTQKKVHNFGAPPEGSGIAIVIEVRPLSGTLPECTERNGFYFYNRSAIIRLVRIGIRIQSAEQFIGYINNLPGDTMKKAGDINGEDEPFPGVIDFESGEQNGRQNNVCWWTVHLGLFPAIHCVSFSHDLDGFPRIGTVDSRYGFLVPVSLDENE